MADCRQNKEGNVTRSLHCACSLRARALHSAFLAVAACAALVLLPAWSRMVSADSNAWLTFLGGSGYDNGYAVALDDEGNIYVTGYSSATWGDGEGTVATNPVRAHTTSTQDAFVAKLDSSGALQWNTFLGGSGTDYGNAIAVDSDGNVYVAGSSDATWQGDSAPVRAYTSGYDAFVAKLDNDGALLWNTFLGGTDSDFGNGIAVDDSSIVSVTGTSRASWQGDYAPRRAYDEGYDAFAARLKSDGVLEWNTFLGGWGGDEGKGIAVDGNGNSYVTGMSGYDWPRDSTTQRPFSSGYDAFIAKLDNLGTLIWNTFLGGSGDDFGDAIALYDAGNLYVAGKSSATWQGTSAPERAYSGSNDVFAAKVDGSGALQWNTFLGSSTTDEGHGIAVDGSNNVYVAGNSYATWQGDSAPVRAYTLGLEAFAAKLGGDGSLMWNTFLGGDGHDQGWGIVVDASTNLHVAGISDAAWGTPIRAATSPTDPFVVKLESDGSLPGDVSVDIDLKAGWNMVSVPVRATDMVVGAVFPDAEAVYTWNPTSKSYETPDTIDPKKSYWVAVTGDDTVTVTGTLVTEWTDALTAGWNMAGSVYGDPVDVADLSDNPSGAVQTNAIYHWNPTAKSYDTASQIQQGLGYWMAATQGCDLTVAPSA